MKLYNGGKIITGLVIFLGIFLAPFAYNMGKAAYNQPKLKMPENEKECIESKEFMRTKHMQLLDQWRDWALRDGQRVYVNSKGKEFEMSLQKTCMKCHTNKAEFSDKCPNYAAVTPYCWDCHIQPEGLKK